MKSFLLCVFSLISFCCFSCTTFLITKEATIDGATIVGHTDDDEFDDQRIVLVKSKDYKKGEKRAVYIEKTSFPRYVGTDRSKAYDIEGFSKSKPIGYIDQVSHTYSYIDANYGIINEHQLAVGECTNSTYYYFEKPDKDRLFGISELSRIALERCKKAKEAVLLIGKLAEEYGYYGWGETLLFGDVEEGWVFEISCTPEGKSAIWAAKKVPEGEAFVAANQFRIQNINKDDKDILYSSNLFDIAKSKNTLENDGSLNWQKLVCPGEFDHPYYSLRRVWRVLSLLSPSSKLSPWVKDAYTKEYPFSIKPDKKIGVRDAILLYRDYYQGTEFDMTKGVASGPYNCPNRYLGKYDRTDFPNKRKTPLKGAWERSISMYYTGYSYIAQLRGHLPDCIGAVVWVGFDNPYDTCYMPLYPSADEIPHSFEYGSPSIYTNTFAWWLFNFSSNWVSHFYKYAIVDLQKKQKELEDYLFQEQEIAEKRAIQLYKKNKVLASKFLSKNSIDKASMVLEKWDSFNKFLVEKYNDGYINKPQIGQMVGYSKEWLKVAEYDKGPVSYDKK